MFTVKCDKATGEGGKIKRIASRYKAAWYDEDSDCVVMNVTEYPPAHADAIEEAIDAVTSSWTRW